MIFIAVLALSAVLRRFSSRAAGFLEQPFVLMRQQMRLDLLHRVHPHRHDDQDRRAAEIGRDRKLRAHHFGHQADEGEVGRAQNQDAVDHVFQVFRGLLARADAGDEAVLVLQVVGHVIGLERHVQRVEIREEDDHRREEQQVQRLARAEIGQDPVDITGPLA
jgi:hypothetical protein